MASNEGAGFKGWAIYAGIPAALAGLAAFFPVGILIAVAAVAAYKHGASLEAAAGAERDLQEERYRREERERDLVPAREQWDAEFEALSQQQERGEIDEEEADARFDDLLNRYPT